MRIFVCILMAALSGTAAAQLPPPDLLLDAGECLVSSPQVWLGSQRESTALELGSVTDTKSYRGDTLLYLVDYTLSTHAEGIVYVFLVEGKSSRATLHLEYSVPFHQTDDGSQRVTLEDPPFGGLASEAAVLYSIHHTSFRDTWTIPVTDLARHSDHVQCTSEATNQ